MGAFSDGPGLYTSAAPGKANYRSIGRGNGGVAVAAKKGLSWRECGFQTTSTIPAKFETVLYTRNSEEKGFGCGAPRFGQELRGGDVPGPGETVASLTGKDAGVGKRGHGSFASRTPRQDDGRKSALAPGPGSYGIPAHPKDTVSEKCDSAPSAAFVMPSSVNPANFTKRPSPGPGDYGSRSRASGKVDSTGAVICRETSRGFDKVAAGPGPGAYDGAAKTQPSSSSSDSAIKVRATELKPEEVEKALTESKLWKRSAEILANENPASSRSVGPGYYNPKDDVTTGGGRSNFSVSESSSFCYGNSHKPRKHAEECPGPGYYQAPTKQNDHRAAAASFASLSHRFKDKEPSAPGPAYYSTKILEESDFHLNLTDRWM